MVNLTKEDLRIISVIIEADEPITAYKIAKILNTYQQKISYRLNLLCEMGIISLNNGDKTRYKKHPIFDCPEHLEQIATHIADIANIIDSHRSIEGEKLEAIIYFILNRVTITKEVTGSTNSKTKKHVCSHK